MHSSMTFVLRALDLQAVPATPHSKGTSPHSSSLSPSLLSRDVSPSSKPAASHLSSSHAFGGLHAPVMPLRWRGLLGLGSSSTRYPQYRARIGWMSMLLLLALCTVRGVGAMTEERIAELRKETVEMFYHGYNNYMDVAFPEDEVSKIQYIPDF